MQHAFQESDTAGYFRGGSDPYRHIVETICNHSAWIRGYCPLDLENPHSFGHRLISKSMPVKHRVDTDRMIGTGQIQIGKWYNLMFQRYECQRNEQLDQN